MLSGLFARQEEERRRIAYELREGTLQHLVALSLTLHSLRDEPAGAEQLTRDRLSCIRTQALAQGIQDIRRLIADLRPPTLDYLGLAPALQSYAERRLSENGVQVHFVASGIEAHPSRLFETSLFRVGQDAIDNIATHADAGTVGIMLKCDGRLLTLVIEDDGKGFEPAEVLADPAAARGLGILSMQERVALVGGTFSVASAPGEGTRVRAEVPLEKDGEGQ